MAKMKKIDISDIACSECIEKLVDATIDVNKGMVQFVSKPKKQNYIYVARDLKVVDRQCEFKKKLY